MSDTVCFEGSFYQLLNLYRKKTELQVRLKFVFVNGLFYDCSKNIFVCFEICIACIAVLNKELYSVSFLNKRSLNDSKDVGYVLGSRFKAWKRTLK